MMRNIRFGQSSGSLQMIPDRERNGGKSIFSPGDTVYVRLYGASGTPQLTPSAGSAKIVAEMQHEHEEYAVFTGEKRVKLTYPASGIVSGEWVSGVQLPAPTVSGRYLHMQQETSGVYRIRYQAHYHLLSVTVQEHIMLLLQAKSGTDTGYLVIDFAGAAEKVRTTLVVRDACSRDSVAQAAVYVDGAFIGLTDDSGRLFLGELPYGRYGLKVVRDGYIPTDQDIVANDYFIIESP